QVVAAGGQVLAERRLHPVGAAAQQEEVGPGRRVAPPHRLDAHAVPPPLGSPDQGQDVASVAVGPQQVRVHVGQPEVGAQAAWSVTLFGRDPRAARRTSSMAVYVARTAAARPAGAAARTASSAAAGSADVATGRTPAYFRRTATSAARRPPATTGTPVATSASKSASQIHETSRPSAHRSLTATRTAPTSGCSATCSMTTPAP